MTDLLNDPAPQTTPAPARGPSRAAQLTGQPSPEVSVTPARLARASRSGAVDTDQLTAWVASEQDHDDDLTAEELTPAELASLSTRRLRILVNRAYTVIDTDYPPYQALDRYQMLVDELDLRAAAAATSGVARSSREKFRDNPLYCRFELFTDGNLAAYVKYTMTGGNLTLVMGTELPGFRDQGADQTLMRNIVLDAHKRRLNLIPRCPMADAFLAAHPQYQQYASRR
jgi:predicted GNAT family acetyltransferase